MKCEKISLSVGHQVLVKLEIMYNVLRCKILGDVFSMNNNNRNGDYRSQGLHDTCHLKKPFLYNLLVNVKSRYYDRK